MDRSPPIGGGQIMRFAASNKARSGFVAAGVAVAGALAGSAEASVIRPTASLPLIGVPYISPSGAGCFDIAMVCVTPGPFTLTSVVSSTFVPGDGLLLPAVQDAVADATYDATLTPIVGSTIVGSVSLKGVVDEQIKGRTSDTETGSFATDITGLSLSGKLMLSGGGPLDGATLMVTLGESPSTGTTTITADGSVFKIDSFFDVFIDVSLPSAGLSTSVGPIPLVAVPEPSTWALMLLGFVGLAFTGYRASRKTTTAAA
jgi:PEP-CTERM motif